MSVIYLLVYSKEARFEYDKLKTLNETTYIPIPAPDAVRVVFRTNGLGGCL